VVDGDVVEPKVVADALRELWGSAGIRGRDVAVGLASQRVTVRPIDLPDLPESELAAAVRLQAADQLPMPVDEALLDYVLVERYAVGDERHNVRVLLVAAEREMVERLLTAVTAAKLRPVLVDLDAFALLRSLATSTEAGDETELIVDIGAAVTKIAVHRGGHPLFVRMVRLGGDASTRELQTVLELSREEAEKAKLDASGAMAAGAELDPDDERAGVLQSGVRRVITEISNSLDFFRSQHEGKEVRRVLISGGASLAPNLAEKLHAELELPVDRGDPLRTVDAGRRKGERADPHDERPFMAVPVGLALGLQR
jgi:type IV pilus assembly protein PilM